MMELSNWMEIMDTSEYTISWSPQILEFTDLSVHSSGRERRKKTEEEET